MLMKDSLEMIPMHELRIVEVTCVFIQISQIDTVREKYSADVSVQSKWREPLLDNGYEGIDLKTFWNPKLYVDNIESDYKEQITLEVLYINKEAFIWEKRRIKSVLHETLELQQFPFDCQDLSVQISTSLPIEEIKLKESNNDISRLNVTPVLESQEWDLCTHVEVSFTEVISDIALGPSKRQRMTFTCRAKRRFGYFIINHLMIGSLLCFMAFTSFGIVVSNTFGRLQMCLVNLLTNVAFKVALGQNLPKISYLTYLDKAILTNLCTISFLLIWHSATSVCFSNIATNTINQTSAQIALMVGQLQYIESILIPCTLGLYIVGYIIFGIIIYLDAGKRRREMSLKDVEFSQKLKLLCTSR